MNYSQDLMNNPAKGLDPIRTASADRINRRYAALPGKISQNMAARGYGSSGNFGNTMYQSEFARSGEMSDLDSLMAQLQLDQQNRGASLGQQLLAQGRGTTTTGTGTAPGDVGGSAFGTAGNALSNVASMLMMSKILKGGLDDPNKTTIRF